ncbi:GLPGLI family protein [Olivibacter sitiensis]|uniref:GLPGLI family protein n=1 Tax=Olivibacter sitiensis TaxID=376470 RepID=UPI0004894DE7|nr:GLPGLI family protein [Olivibacter sitiensis]
MKRHLISAILLLSALTSARAQEEDTAMAQIKYEFIHIDDTTQQDNPYMEDMLLLIGPSSSVYKSYTAIKGQQELKRQMEEQKGNSDIKLNIDLGGKSRSNTIYYNQPKDNKFYKTDRIAGTEYLIEEKYPELAWQISEETKDISGYTCQKATTNYAGRNYTAWFTTELPFPFGPWKLSGLPGLIIEAEDDKQEVQFKYLAFDKLEGEQQESLLASEKAIKTNQKAFDKAFEAFRKDPSAAFRAAGSNVRPGSSVTMSTPNVTSPTSAEVAGIRSVTVSSGTTSNPNAKKKNKNNPLELKGAK